MSQFFERATDPSQYDKPEMRWETEGGRQNFIRRLFMERLSPFIGDVAGQGRPLFQLFDFIIG
jgi:hypothetical protein